MAVRGAGMSRYEVVIAGAILILTACTSPPAALENADELDINVCDPGSGQFNDDIDNPYLPFHPGQRSVLEGPDGSRQGRVAITVLLETQVVDGVETRVVEEREWINDALVEVSRNFVAQSSDGTVCYFGEDVDDYRDGEIVGHAGAWRAGESGYRPGILMPADPQPGTSHKQEVAPGVAEDLSVIQSVGEVYTVPYGTFEDTVETLDVNPLSGGSDPKRYAKGVGLILDERLVLVSFEP